MRTSHLAIRRMIADKKGKLTDEQIFASRQYAAYLTDIAEGVTKRYGRSSKVKKHACPSPGCQKCSVKQQLFWFKKGMPVGVPFF